MASAFVRLTKRWLNVVNSEYWEAVLLIVLYFILRWFPTLRGIAVVILASSCVSIINELIFRYGALYLRIHTWDMLSKESRYDMGSDMINGVWGSMGGLLISIAFVPFLPIYIVAMPFVIIYALVKYRRPKDKNISIFWFKIGAFFYTNFVSEYHEMISVVSESGGEQFDAFEEWAPPTEAADEDMDGDGEEDEEAKETLSWVMEKIFSSVYYMPLIPVVFFLLFMFFLFGIALLICAVPAAIFATVAVYETGRRPRRSLEYRIGCMADFSSTAGHVRELSLPGTPDRGRLRGHQIRSRTTTCPFETHLYLPVYTCQRGRSRPQNLRRPLHTPCRKTAT